MLLNHQDRRSSRGGKDGRRSKKGKRKPAEHVAAPPLHGLKRLSAHPVRNRARHFQYQRPHDGLMMARKHTQTGVALDANRVLQMIHHAPDVWSYTYSHCAM